jgi:hypothetical protein
MGVRIDEPRTDELSRGIDDGAGAGLGNLADIGDASPPNADAR